MSTTALTLEQNIAKDTGLGFASGVPTAGAATTTTDTSSDSPFSTGDSSSLFKNAFLKITADSAGTPRNVGETRQITTYTVASQQVTHDTFAYSVATTMTYNVYVGIPPSRIGIYKGILDYINDTLRAMRYRRRYLLTLVTDGDMETSGTTNYAGTNATLAKSTTASQIFQGDQSLSVTATSDDGYAALASNLSVYPNHTYQCAVDFITTGGTTVTLNIWDATNAASIDSVDSEGDSWSGCLYKQFTTPTTCKLLNIRLTVATSGQIVYFDNLSLRNASAREMALPSAITDHNWIEELEYIYGGSQTGAGDALAGDEQEWHNVHWWGLSEDEMGATPYRIQYAPAIPDQAHLFLRVVRPYAELSADTDTTDADPDVVMHYALANIYADRGDKDRATMHAAQGKTFYRAPRIQRRLMLTKPF